MVLKRKPHVRRITAALGLRRRPPDGVLFHTTVQTDDLRLLLEERQYLADLVVKAAKYWPPGQFRIQEIEDASRDLETRPTHQRSVPRRSV